MKKKIILMTLCLICLTACSSERQVIKTEYIKQQIPPLPAEPQYYPVEFRKIDNNYCLDAQNAKNLLKNRELDKGYQQELREILQGLK